MTDQQTNANASVDLTGKVAAITGGTRGIGRGIAEALLAAGASVAVNGRNPEKGAIALSEMAAGDRAIFVPGDVTQQQDVENFIDTTITKFGKVDILINNAGGSSGFAPVSELSDDVKDMSTRNFGRIINISSVEGRQANKVNVSHYITFKHALNGFTKAVAFEWGAQGITCNALSPGAVETDLMQVSGPAAAETMGISYEKFLDGYAQDAAIKRLNTVDEVAILALLLCSDLGGGITGGILPVDGGTAL